MKHNTVYPENGSVIIIDDQIEEALPLMRALSKHNISYKYFTGKNEDLPEKPLSNVKIIFLDIQLEGMEGVQNDRTKLTVLANIISKIVDNSCFPYMIIAWTKHQDLVDELNKYLKNNNPPFIILAIGKEEVKENDEYNVNKIEEKLKEEINKSEAFQFFLKWQNIANTSSIQVVNEVASIYPLDNQWDKNIKSILNMLAEAYAGKQAGNEGHKNALMCFNNLYLDIIENNILSGIPDFHIDIQEMKNLNDNEIKGELNRRLLISFEKSNFVVPGNIYEENDCFEFIKLNPKDVFQKVDVEFKKKLEECLKRFEFGDCNEVIKRVFKIFKKQLVECCSKPNTEYEDNKFFLIYLEVSPFCDYAQNKWKMHRILPGISWPFEYERNLKKADYIYKTPLFRIDNKLLFYVFDIRYLTSLPLEALNNVNSKKRFRKELLNDIQTKIASHINRPGITSV
ncbi:MAG: hypothetical protein ABIN00_04995 [candidate division WOR-3 bacterium]